MGLSLLHRLGLVLLAGSWYCSSAFQLPLSPNAMTKGPSTTRIAASTTKQGSKATELDKRKEALKRTLMREYASFFNPMEKEYYNSQVEFIDPLTRLRGVDKYQKNVDFLGARTLFGKFMFSDGGIVLHNFQDIDEKTLLTRWTLRICAKVLPWSPVARFTGVSIYDLDDEGKVLRQTDYWDSVNLEGGKYKERPVIEGVKDFLDQLSPKSQAQPAMNRELPYELLRRAPEYEVRRYPAFEAVETEYETRPEGYDRLGTYTSGWNEERRNLRPLSPSMIQVPKDIEQSDGDKKKYMRWPMSFENPLGDEFDLGQQRAPRPAADSKMKMVSYPERVVAVIRFPAAATEPVVKFYAKRLEELIAADGLGQTKESSSSYMVAQYDAIFSIGDRRNEVWIPLDKHDWQ